MPAVNKVSLSLFFLRISVFLVFFMWTIDKFINPSHAAVVWEHFYFIKGMETTAIYIVGAVQLVILLGFVLGVKKKICTLLILFMHTVSTLSSYQQYFNPWEGPNLLFFAAWPMLAACFAVYYLRESDNLWSLNIR